MSAPASRQSEQADEVLEKLWTSLVEGGHDSMSLDDPALRGYEAGVAELVGSHFILRRDGRIYLSQPGREAASRAVRRHRLAERMAVDVLAIDAAKAEDAACGLEHSLREGVDEAVCSLLGHPERCPHGNPIPAGDCCHPATDPSADLAPLSHLKPGQAGRIAYVQLDEPRRLQKLMAMGILPGKTIKLVQGFPSYVFQIGHSQFAVDRDIARSIHVRRDRRPALGV